MEWVYVKLESEYDRGVLVFETAGTFLRSLPGVMAWVHTLKTPDGQEVESVELPVGLEAYTSVPSSVQEALDDSQHQWVLANEPPDETFEKHLDVEQVFVSSTGLYIRARPKHVEEYLEAWIPARELAEWAPDPLRILAEGEL